MVAAVASLGCISRSVLVESEPAGAEVRLNGVAVGETPVLVPFKQYGVYSVELTKEGRATVRAREKILAPWYARFPLCLFSELLLPGRIRDERRLSYRLSEPAPADRAGLLERARGSE
jgi:hypothetical protein